MVQNKNIVCDYEGCSYYPPVRGVYTCKYCGRTVDEYNPYRNKEEVESIINKKRVRRV